MDLSPRRGEIWLADLNPTRGHEQAGCRPVLVVSEDLFNRGPAKLVVVLPLTTRIRRVPSHVVITPPEGGLRQESAVICEAIRSITHERLIRRWGMVESNTLTTVNDALAILLSIFPGRR